MPVCAKTGKTIAYLFPLRENSNNCSGGSGGGGTLPEVNLPLPILDVEGAFGIVKQFYCSKVFFRRATANNSLTECFLHV